jgi:hypothetical protein
VSASALFVPTSDEGSGSYYAPVSQRIAELPRGRQHAADQVWKALMELLRRGQTQATVTDRMLRQTRWLRHYSLRFIQKGLQALESLGLIERRRARGLRTIVILDRLRGRARPKPRARAEAAAPAPHPIPAGPPVPAAAAAAAKAATEQAEANWATHKAACQAERAGDPADAKAVAEAIAAYHAARGSAPKPSA